MKIYIGDVVDGRKIESIGWDQESEKEVRCYHQVLWFHFVVGKHQRQIVATLEELKENTPEQIFYLVNCRLQNALDLIKYDEELDEIDK